MNATKTIVFLILLLDILSLGIFIPVTSMLVDYYSTSSFWISFGTTLYSLCVFVFAPLLWQRSDKYWRKPILFLCLFGTLLSSIGLLLTHNVLVYLISRAINWITGGNVSILQAILNDISESHAERTKLFGFMWAIFGMWFIVWPLLWAWLSYFWINVVFLFMIFFAAASILISYFYLPETHKTINSELKTSVNTFAIFKKYFVNHNVRNLILTYFFLWTASFCYQSVFVLYMKDFFGIEWNISALILALIGVMLVVSQAVLIPRYWIKNRSQKMLLRVPVIFWFISFFLLSIVSNFWVVVIILSIFPIFYSLLWPVYNTELIEHTWTQSAWEVTGLIASVWAFFMFTWASVWQVFLGLHVSPFFPHCQDGRTDCGQR
jgi:DHA1 family tetracycline resistance protein-like MFS transporter